MLSITGCFAMVILAIPKTSLYRFIFVSLSFYRSKMYACFTYMYAHQTVVLYSSVAGQSSHGSSGSNLLYRLSCSGLDWITDKNKLISLKMWICSEMAYSPVS